MELDKIILINSFFISLIVILFYLIYNNLLETNSDFYVILLGIIASLIIIFIRTAAIIDIAHFLFCGPFLFYLALATNNKYLLALNIFLILCIIQSRYYYGKCLLNTLQNGTGFFSGMGGNIRKYFPYWDGRYRFPILLTISILRFYLQFKVV